MKLKVDKSDDAQDHGSLRHLFEMTQGLKS